ncbi:EamA family transporter [Candidatus Bathyarchaeota archaeon]|nr:EamA family transporter [Candidatus Bathyarchaeota archaeon]
MISAISHAFWNLLAKKGLNKMAFIWLTSFSSLISVLPAFILILPRIFYPINATPFLLASGFIEALYFISLVKAYEAGDLSLVYPLARSSPLIVLILAVVFLKETISSWGIIGLSLVILGVYVIHLRSFSFRDFIHPIVSLRSRASQWALMTAIWTSIYSLIDKMAVGIVDPILYAFWLDIFIVIFLTPIVFKRLGLRRIVAEFKENRMNPIVSGFLMRAGYVLVLVALSLSQLSYIISIRQLSIVLGSFLGITLLHEPYGKSRLIGSILIFSGVFTLSVLG